MKKIIALTLALIMSLSCFSLMSFAEETETTEHLTEVPEGYIGIYTIEDLYCIRNNLTANYILMNDIDLSEATAEGGDWNYAGRGWNPIGSNDNYSGLAFSGVFDGNGYSIKGINIYILSLRKDPIYIGLFSNVNGTIKNLNVEGKINANISPYSYAKTGMENYIGSIAAKCSNNGTITNCSSNIEINAYIYTDHAYSYTSYTYVGGIVGFNNGTITNCINSSNITTSYKSTFTTKNYIGGIAGYGNGSISNSINSGDITTTTQGATNSGYSCQAFASGISCDGSIENSYNVADLHSSDSCGVTLYGSASKCYNIGKCDYAIYFDGSATKCYYLEGTGRGFSGTTSLTNAQMKLQSMYSGWDFDTVWTMDGREDYPYPELRDVPLVLPEDLTHKHEYTSEVTKEPTHLEEGEATYICDCGDSYTEAIAKLEGHTYTSKVTKEATHLEEGETTYTCECGDSYTEAIAKLEGHTYTSKVTKEATHLEEGETTYTCECGDSYTEAIAKLEGHTYTSKVTKEATHLEEGETTYTCACGDSYTEAIAKLQGHTYKTSVTAPTCTTKGYTTYTCECGDSYKSDYVATKPHSYSSTVTKPATHLSEGVKAYTCSACGDTYTEAIAKLQGHTYTSEITKEATHLKEGETTYTCACGDTYTEAIAKLTAHTYEEVVTDPTCTSKGYTTYTCKCGDSYVDDYVAAYGHNMSEFVIVREATCASNGEKRAECSRCDYIETQKISAYGHKDANQDGYCDECNDYIADDNCSCICHTKGIWGLLYKIILHLHKATNINLLKKVFTLGQYCKCSIAHY